MATRRIQFSEPATSGSQVEGKTVSLAERALAISAEQKITYGEALTLARNEQAPASFADGRVTTPVLTPAFSSVVLRDAATHIAKQRNISFCEALPIARRELANMADEVVTPAQINSAVAAAIKDAFAQIMGGKAMIIGGSDTFKVESAVAEALSQLHVHQNAVTLIKSDVSAVLASNLDKSTLQAHMTPADVDSIAASAASRAENIYTKDVARLGGSFEQQPSVVRGSQLAEEIKKLATEVEEFPTRAMAELRKKGLGGIQLADAQVAILVKQGEMEKSLESLKRQLAS